MMKSLGDRLRQLRMTRKLSAEDVAGWVGIDRTHLYRVERGEGWPGLELLTNLAATYRVDMADLWTFSSEHPRHRLRALTGQLSNDDVSRAIKAIEDLLDGQPKTGRGRKRSKKK